MEETSFLWDTLVDSKGRGSKNTTSKEEELAKTGGVGEK